MSINHNECFGEGRFLSHARIYIHIQLANSNIVKTSDLSRKKLSGSGKWGGSEILDWWDYRRNRISFNFVCSFLSAQGSRPSSRWLPGTNLLTSVHSRGKWHQRARLLCHITNYFIHSQIYADGTIEQPLLTRNWVLSLSVITVK